MNYMKYLTPEDIDAAEKMAGIDDPTARMATYGGMQQMIDRMGVKQLPTRSNDRVVGLTSPMEAIGGIANNLVQTYGNASLAKEYGDILDKNNASRKETARYILSKYRAQALRNAGLNPVFDSAPQEPVMQTDPF